MHRAAVSEAITHGAKTPKAVAEMTEMKPDNVQKLLSRMVADGLLEKAEHGKYDLIGSQLARPHFTNSQGRFIDNDMESQRVKPVDNKRLANDIRLSPPHP
jgi:hypothetical protein